MTPITRLHAKAKAFANSPALLTACVFTLLTACGATTPTVTGADASSAPSSNPSSSTAPNNVNPAGASSVPEQAAGSKAYVEQLALVKGRSKEADFTKLRLAYTDTQYYHPYMPQNLDSVFGALEAEDYAACNRHALAILDPHIINIGANYAAMVCHKALGLEDKSSYHRFILDGLLSSIVNSGDGKSPETAFTVISTGELYAFLNLSGLQATGQSLIHDNGRAYDLMDVTDSETEESFQLYFDITLQMSRGFD